MNELDRILALIRARSYVEKLRAQGLPWDRVKDYTCANPLKLSARQLCRVYEGEDAYQFDRWKKAVDRAIQSRPPHG